MDNHISCCVNNCKYNNNTANTCTASRVSVANCCSDTTPKKSFDTMCDTFAPRN